MMSKALKKKLGKSSVPPRATRQEPQKGGRFPAPPGTFAAEERRIWRKIVRHYVLEEPAALALLRSTLEAHARMRRCGESISRVGELIREGKGDKARVKAHPLISAERDSRAAWLAGLRALGILDIPE